MDESILIQTINNAVQRHVKTVQNYETEVTNLIAENLRLQSEINAAVAAKEDAESRLSQLLLMKTDEKETS